MSEVFLLEVFLLEVYLLEAYLGTVLNSCCRYVLLDRPQISSNLRQYELFPLNMQFRVHRTGSSLHAIRPPSSPSDHCSNMTAGLLHLSGEQHHAGASSDTNIRDLYATPAPTLPLLKVDAEETLIPVEQGRICGEPEGTDTQCLTTDSNQHLPRFRHLLWPSRPGLIPRCSKTAFLWPRSTLASGALPLPINYLKLSSRTGAKCTADGALGH